MYAWVVWVGLVGGWVGGWVGEFPLFYLSMACLEAL